MLREKYNPIFTQMEIITRQQKLEYLDRMTSNLDKNFKRTNTEKETLDKL
jgi:hypothetical protein